MFVEEKWELARGTNTSVEILERLSKDKYQSVRWEVAKNPNTPMKILKKLLKDKDEYVRYAVFKNPKCPEIMKLLFE